MSKLSSQIASIQIKVKALIVENERLKTQYKEKEDELLQLHKDNQQLVDALYKSQQNVNDLKTANAILGSDDYKTKTKLKINALVKEIDHCINQLAS